MVETSVPRSLSEYVAKWALDRPDRLALAGTRRLTWAEVNRWVDVVAWRLRHLGFGEGDVIAMLSPQSWQFAVTFLAVDRLGGVFVGLNTRNRPAEFAAMVNDARPRVLLSVTEFNGRDYRPDIGDVVASASSVEHLLWVDDDGPGGLFTDRDVRQVPVQVEPAPVTDDAASCVIYTSGSTGVPKGAILPRRGLLVNHEALARRIGHEPFVAQSDHPIDHVGGLDRLLLVTILGGTLVMAPRFDPEALVEQLMNERVSFWMGESTQIRKVEPYLEGRVLPHLKVCMFVGDLPRRVMSRVLELGPALVTAYGMTEMCSAVTASAPQADVSRLADGAIGTALETMECRVVDADERALTDVLAVGELQVRSACSFLGYLNKPAETRAKFTKDGWYRTGDLVQRIGREEFRFLNRIDNVFKSGGYNIYPGEIEGAAMTHPAVQHAALVAVGDDIYGAVGHLYVAAADAWDITEHALRQHLAAVLANYKLPKFITIADGLPQLPNNKIDRKALSTRASQTRTDRDESFS